jgi:hypothetical protein
MAVRATDVTPPTRGVPQLPLFAVQALCHQSSLRQDILSLPLQHTATPTLVGHQHADTHWRKPVSRALPYAARQRTSGNHPRHDWATLWRSVPRTSPHLHEGSHSCHFSPSKRCATRAHCGRTSSAFLPCMAIPTQTKDLARPCNRRAVTHDPPEASVWFPLADSLVFTTTFSIVGSIIPTQTTMARTSPAHNQHRPLTPTPPPRPPTHLARPCSISCHPARLTTAPRYG